MLDGDVFVLQLARFVLGLSQNAVEAAGDVDLVGRPGDARDLGQALDFLDGAAMQALDVDAGLDEDGGSEAVGLFEQRGEDVLDIDLLVAVADGGGLSGADGLLGLFG